MEVDSWVSVQARRERFEQLYEDSPIASSHNTPFHPAPRPRTLSTPTKNLHNSDELRSSGGKNANINNHEWDCKISKYASNTEPCLKGSEVPTSGKNLKNYIKVKEQVDHPSQKDGETLKNIVIPLSGTSKNIPVFKPASSVTNRKHEREEEAEIPISDSQGKRGRFFSHIRSRSHGNFIMKRDSSAEKNITVGQQNGIMGYKENKSHKDWPTPKCKQRSIDNLLSREDSKSSSSFESKQRLVSNVKNIKNKETPTVLRKFSFSSKNEKDMKNMKEKFVSPNNARHKQPGFIPSVSHKSNKQKLDSRDSGINMDRRLITEKKTAKNKSHASDIAMVPVLIAKTVAEVASKRCIAQTRFKINSLSSMSSEDRFSDPPARPPRRRATGAGPTPKRKGKAPSPPSESFTAIINQNQEIESDSLFQISSPEESPGNTSHMFRDSTTDDLKSYESPSSYHSPERCFENLNEIVHINSTPVNKFFSNSNSKSVCKSLIETRHGDNGKKTKFRIEIQSVSLKNTRANTVTKTHHDNNETLEQNNTTEAEGLPPGPPPKKPPRTFAYDIYKNTSMPSLEIEGDDSSKKDKAEGKVSQPIYAVPVKKKNNKVVPKSPIRSKSDLSKEIIKPSVAPKPPHVLAKAKRASLVDPLSNLEKDEDAAITTEFQRQAHVRYSLRKPNKLPPTLYCDREENTQNNSHSEHINSSLEIQHDPNYSTIYYENESNLTSNYSKQKKDTKCMTNNSPGAVEIKSHPMRTPYSQSQDNCQSEYEDITPITSSISSIENEQPLSLTYCFARTPSPDVMYLHTKRSMSDETLYKASVLCPFSENNLTFSIILKTAIPLNSLDKKKCY